MCMCIIICVCVVHACSVVRAQGEGDGVREHVFQRDEHTFRQLGNEFVSTVSQGLDK